MNLSSGHHTPILPRTGWRTIWQIAISRQLLATALLGIAALLLLAAGLPQAPADRAEYSRWLAQAQTRFGATMPLLQALGLFAVYNSLVWRALLGLVGGALALRVIDDLDNTRGNLLRILATLGGLILLGGLTVSSLYSWRAPDISLGIAESASLGARSPYLVRLDELNATAAHLTLVKQTDPVASGYLPPGRALHLGGVAMRMTSTGHAVRASAVISTGHSLNLLAAANSTPATELLLRFTADESERFVALPDIGWLARISSVPPANQLRVIIYRTRTGAILFKDVLPANGLIKIQDVVLQLKPEKYINLQAYSDPGAGLVALGAILGMMGLAGLYITTWRANISPAAPPLEISQATEINLPEPNSASDAFPAPEEPVQ